VLLVIGAAMLVAIANTGGLTSPLLLSVAPFYVAVSMDPALERRRPMFAIGLLVVFAAMAWLTRESPLPPPLAPSAGVASIEYVALSLLSVFTAIVAIHKVGSAVSSAYERITLELAERREELCDENAGRTQALEGIAARLAHEVKNPLAAIKGLSQHMARNAEDPKIKERLSIVAGEAERLQDIVDGFLSFSRGLDDLQIAQVRPFDVAREISLLLETRAVDANISLEVGGSRELSLAADAKKLRQALLNLVLNAMQASSSGSVVTLEVAKQCSDGACVIRISDRGHGMTADILERIRKPYYTTKSGGSGLGIAVARGIAEQHGGTLCFESSPGRGTTAIVSLPASADPTRPALPNPCKVTAVAEKACNAVAAMGRSTQPR